MLLLCCRSWSGAGDPYRIAENDVLGCTLEEAAEAEAGKIASDAGSDLLESPEQWCRDQLAGRVRFEMLGELRGPNDRYTAPDGTLYWLEERHDGEN